MHELALAQSVVDIVVAHASRDGFARARVVHLEIGALSHVMPEALVAGFDAAAQGTVAEAARMEIHQPPGRAWCADCEAEVEVPSRLADCPRCKGSALVVTGGTHMRILELEVE